LSLFFSALSLAQVCGKNITPEFRRVSNPIFTGASMRWLTLILCLALIPTFAQSTHKPLAILNVNVIPMDQERVLVNQTVLVRDGVIVELGAANTIKVPQDAMRIDGRGKYLLPGLTDMHAHLLSDENFPDELAPDELAVMLANGVTTIRLMIGTPEHLTLRERVRKGELLGPTIYAASPQLAGRAFGSVFNGRAVQTPEAARQAVRDFKLAGYDFIKLTFFITPAVYDAITETAREVGIRVIGHVEPNIGLQRALAAGQQIEHLDSYLEAVLRDDAPSKDSVTNMNVYRMKNWESLDYIDDQKIKEVARATAAAKVWNSPTMTVLKLAFSVGASEAEITARPDYRYWPKKLRELYWASQKKYWANAPSEKRRQRYTKVRNEIVKEIHQAGGKILAGSDTPEFFLMYGFTLHRELKSYVEAGLSPYAALETATRNPAEYLQTLDKTGTVTKGKRADLVLLDASPLANIENTNRIAGVVVKGKWLPQADLKQMLETSAQRFEKASAAQQ
jgi:imidazolonepropionase-like amidohydrolase